MRPSERMRAKASDQPKLVLRRRITSFSLVQRWKNVQWFDDTATGNTEYSGKHPSELRQPAGPLSSVIDLRLSFSATTPSSSLCLR